MDSSSETSHQEDALNRCRWFRINWKWCEMGRSSVGINIRLNPVVSFVSALIIWGFVAWCMIEPEAANKQMEIWKLWVQSIQPEFQLVRPGKVVSLKWWTRVFEIFPVGLNRSIEFWTEMSGNFGEMDCALWITRTFTWMYLGMQDVWAVFIIVLYFSKYGEMKLGKPDEKPEFKDASYFTMLFAAGIGIGLFYFGIGKNISVSNKLV